MAEIFREARNRGIAFRVVLDAVDTAEHGSVSAMGAQVWSETRDGIKASGRQYIAVMRKGDFDAVGEPR